MFKIESYVTPILLSYVDKYVRDFKPADAQVSLWGGGVALHNLVLKPDVLQQEVALPFTLISGRIHELLIQVPWTKIMSEPIVVTIDTIECILSLRPRTPLEEGPPPDSPSHKSQVVEAPPGYMQALVRRIVSNITLRVHHLIVKYVQDDIVLSLNVKHLSVDAAGPDWEPAFADIDQNVPLIRRLVRLDDFTLCLDHCDADGKIRFYQEPLLYRCQIDLRVLTRLVSANTRRAKSLSVQLRSSKLAWGVTSDQLTLLLRLLKERTLEVKSPQPTTNLTSKSQTTPSRTSSLSNTAEPARRESWSEWAWSWMPAWKDREGGIEEAPTPATCTPIYFVAFFDDVSLVYKIMETDGSNRKRARGILDLQAKYAAVKTILSAPTLLSTRIGTRSFIIQSNGKCACGYLNYNASNDKPTVYVAKTQTEECEEAWAWPEEAFADNVEMAEAVDEEFRDDGPEDQGGFHLNKTRRSETVRSDNISLSDYKSNERTESFWSKMEPLIYLEFLHERSPPTAYMNPYDNPPTDFQYSDWQEENNLNISLQPMDIWVSMDLIHRFEAFWSLYREQAVVVDAETPRTLTVEEGDALYENLPQRRINIDLKGLRIRLEPWDHGLSDKPVPINLVLDLDLPQANIAITGPLYPHRVCSAACQMPATGPLWQGARLHVTATLPAVEAKVCSPSDGTPKSCARADLTFVLHLLLNQQYFTKKESVLFSYTLKTREVNIYGSTARLMAAVKIPLSLLTHKVCLESRYTSLPRDAINDEESVALDVTFEEFAIRGYVTNNVNTHIMTLQSTRATLIHATEGNEPKQAWLFSVRDVPSTTPFLRMAVQWCEEKLPNSLDYLGIWTEPIDFCVDPLFVSWLAYKPTLNPVSDIQSQISLSKALSSSQHFLRRRPIPSVQSSSGRGGSRSGSGAELVHVRPRSVESSSELSDKKDKPPPQAAQPLKAWLNGEQMIKLHQRLRHILINVELGLVVVYVTMTTASAVDCATPHMTMERHATSSNHVLAINIGRWNLHSSYATRDLWQDIRHDGPTFIAPKTEKTTGAAPTDDDISFPWKLVVADVACYTMVVRAVVDRCGREKSSSGLRSQLKTNPLLIQLNTILELVTTTVTLSVVTKTLQYKSFVKKPDPKRTAEPTKEEKKMKYFTSGTTDFRPTTLKEFVRGPAKRTKSSADQTDPIEQDTGPDLKITSGPIVSFGFHVHADTPPVIVRLEQDQVHVVAAAAHCFRHIVALLGRPPLIVPKGYVPSELSQRSFIRSVSEMDEQQSLSESARSESRSELIPIFDPHADRDDVKISAFFWFQWVISRAALVVATYQVKLAFDVDDIISTIDLQEHYNQVKLKLASASVKHYEKNENDEWKPGALGGRVLEAREPVNAKQENNFLCITITQAQISNLPESWKEELHPKLLQQKSTIDRVWEIYATLAPLEAVLEPSIVENIISLVKEMKPRDYCSLQTEVKRSTTWQWPFVYLSAGGLRLLLTCKQLETKTDDTLMFILGKVTANPHPENPICRRPTNSCDAGWATVDGGFEGRQYELLFKNVAVRSAQFQQLVNQELSETVFINSGENPAHKWSQPVVSPVITPILHSLDVGCVLAPAHYVADAVVFGSGIELNLMSDCAVELSIDQLDLIQKVIRDMKFSFKEEDLESVMIFDNEQQGVCPYTTMSQVNKFDLEEQSIRSFSNVTVVEEDLNAQSDKGRSVTDSGVDTSASRLTFKSNRFPEDNTSLKKKMAVGFSETQLSSSDYLEIFVTMGTIELSLYTADDGSPEVAALRPVNIHAPGTPGTPGTRGPAVSPLSNYQFLTQKSTKFGDEEEMDGRRSKSLTETIRNADIGKTNLDIALPVSYARKGEGNLPLIYVTFHQPNFYYWKKKSQKGFQVSLFNAWIGLGAGLSDDQWHAVLLSTARGEPDPVTDIPPALATMKLTLPFSGNPALGSTCSISSQGSFRLDIERPILLEISTDRLTRLKGILSLIQRTQLSISRREADAIQVPILHKVRRFMVRHCIESATVQTSQIGVAGPDGAAGWDGASLHVSWAARPERLAARALLTALLVASGPEHDARLPVLQPLQLGMELEATWEAWRRAEGGKSARLPTVRAGLELDRVSIDARPSDLDTLNNIRETLITLFSLDKSHSSENMEHVSMNDPASVFAKDLHNRNSASMGSSDGDCNDHYYKDDLRSGAFKIVSGGQLPMAYQVTLHRNSVSWRYPHPRAITRLVAFPLPGRDKEIDCVLELYNSILSQWEPHSYFKVPVNEPSELHLHVAPPEAVFSNIWRFRVHSKNESRTPFEFDMNKFLPNIDTVMTEQEPDKADPMGVSEVTAEELSGILRVDSFFAPRLLPRFRLSVRLTALDIHVHNSLLSHYSKTSNLEGYYVSKPLMRSHRVVTFTGRDVAVHGHFGCIAGKLILINTQISGDILDCATGTMEQLVDEFRVQAAVSMPREGLENLRLRFRTSNIHAMLHVPRLRTLHALAIDWKMAFEESLLKSAASHESKEESLEKSKLNKDVTTASLEGRVSLWVENCSGSALRVGQEGTDEVVPLGPGVTLAYRWRSPVAVRKLRFAFANPTADWHWSNSISFTPGCSRVRLEEAAPTSSAALPAEGVYAHVTCRRAGADRHLQLAGRLVLANMLRLGLHYKVRARSLQTKTWRALTAGEIAAESVGRSVICSVSCEMVLKIKLTEQNSGWSGDIPLKECPKENVPWLVKVPSEGEVPYVSVWCRVVRARSDGRVLAAIWPLYVLRSNLPLDTDVLIATETNASTTDLPNEEPRPSPIIQVAPGRGCNIHLLAPGTTSARHTLSFQYRNIACPVTREAVPLHYGVTDTSVFDKRAPVNSINEVTQDVHAWLERSARTVTSSWPYSIVSKHWPGTWQPAQLQPRCDVTVRYQAVRAGGGCSLEVRLSPVLLLCNASPIALTMRAHDASPLCKTDPGSAISLPSSMLQKPFFMSVETGRDAFVSGPLEVCATDPGRYGAPAPGQVAIDHPANFAIQCNQKVALLTLYYEIKEEINILGITAPYMLINRLDTDILVSSIAVPKDVAKEVQLRTMSFKVVRTCPEGSIHGIPLCRFWLRDRWRGGNASELNLFLCLALPLDSYPASAPVPVRLGAAPVRRALSLMDSNNKSLPVVVIQHKHEGRWLVTVAPDPCPQFLVHNRTQMSLAIAQPVNVGDEPSSSAITAVGDCSGVRWWCTVEQNAVTHYSTPAHCERYPSPTDSTAVPLPFLTFARISEDDHENLWCSPVAVADGEQLIQLDAGNTAKLRIRTHPHSTLIELQDVDQHDISASDIRKRLAGPIFSDQTLASIDVEANIHHDKELQRVLGESKLIESGGTHRRSSQQTLQIFSGTSIGLLKLALTSTHQKESKSTDSLKIKNTESNEDGNLNTIEQKTVEDENSNVKDLQVDNDQYPSTSTGAIEGKNLKIQESETVKEEIVNSDSTIATDENLKTIVSETLKDETVNVDEQKLRDKSEADFADVCSQCIVDEFSSSLTITQFGPAPDACSYIYQGHRESEWEEDGQVGSERIRCVVASVALEMAVAGDTRPLFAVHLDRATVQISALSKKIKTTLSIADIQIDNLQYDSGQFDFAVVATTRAEPLEADQWPALWNMFADRTAFATRENEARLLLKITHDKWKVVGYKITELTEFDIRLGPLALYVEDAYVTALIELFQLASPSAKASELQSVLSEVHALQCPLRFRLLYIHPLELTLTLHTAVRVYIALDQSPLHLSAFELRNMMTSTESLAHALTVHYLSAAILGAGWVVGGLELLGAPGALAARVGGATGGVRGIASAAAAALLRSLSAWAGSLARNLDLLAGDEEHARRAAAARRRPPDSLMAGLIAGITNFAINILGAVGGLAHHPLVGVAVGETESGAAALRRGLLGALTKPLSATADLVAYAGHGLLRQTGWDPVPQPRSSWSHRDLSSAGWKRDCVRWTFRLAELSALAGFEVLLDNASLQLLLTHKFLVVADSDSERIVEMIDFRFCELRPYQGAIIELCVTQRRTPKTSESRGIDEDDEYQISAAAMARVARYTGAEGAAPAESRVLSLLPMPGQSHALYAALAAAIHHNADSHFALL